MFEPTKWVICHIDKDLDQAPGKHYNYSKQKNYYISEQEAEYKFYEQVLVGDTSDGYKGCPNIGKVRCARILDPDSAHLGEQRTTWELIVDTYASKGLTHEDALQQARVARMLTPNEWDGADNIELWSPIDGD
jgi:DNA polymerase-1